jgi:hypothetical protein
MERGSYSLPLHRADAVGFLPCLDYAICCAGRSAILTRRQKHGDLNVDWRISHACSLPPRPYLQAIGAIDSQEPIVAVRDALCVELAWRRDLRPVWFTAIPYPPNPTWGRR